MNITIIIGWLGAFAAVVISIFIAGELAWFLDPASVFVVIVGTAFAMVATITPEMAKGVGKYFKLALFPPKFNPAEYIKDLVEYATIARSKGLLALEEGANAAKDPFMKQALMLIVDANDPDKVREMLESAVDHTAERHAKGADFFAKGVTFGPAFGMMGTVVGLVSMLQVMGDNPEDMGGSMATAVITTLYGSMLSNIICAPMESALKHAHTNEELCMNIVIEGVMAIASGSNPRLIQEKLEFMLPRSGRGKAEKTK
ncbi:MAG: MotA/TolQ/ExbB proton channel family protein [Oscillospiraceae bacterium]|jgi:chemotaxis protein MotA|nr:MotA/TolQ/ExbB proton channel family protein [Oscillospiraceae bacterium]